MSETFAWPEGAIYLWTGTATARAIPAYAQQVQGTFTQGWDNFATLDGTWHNVLTGQRAEITIGALYTVDTALRALADAQTGVHLHLTHSALGASAGYLLYSGRFDRMTLAGREGEVFRFSLAYHANEWSAYG